jgi:hypothetical protein
MRPILLLAAALLAGCAAPSDATLNAASSPGPASAAAATPTHVEGVAWLPDDGGASRATTEIAFPVNASPARLTVALHLGSRYAGWDLPTSSADVEVELRAPDGAVLAKASLRADAGVDKTLDARTNETGMHKLALLSYAGSDGSGMGDYVGYKVDARSGP